MLNPILLLKRLYPLEERKPMQVKLALFFGLIVFLVLYILNPFGNNGSNRIYNCIYAGLLTSASILLDFFILFPLFPNYFKEEKWTVGREIIFTLIIISTIATLNVVAGNLIWDNPISINNWFKMLLYTAMIGIAPATASILINQARLLKKYRREVTNINNEINHINVGPDDPITAAEPIKVDMDNNEGLYQDAQIIIEAENSKDNLSITSSTFLAATSADNYVKVYYLKDHTLKTSILRTTLKKIEGNLEGNTQFFRCHRTAIINLAEVKNLVGSAQGYRLQINHLTETIPVSRNLNAIIKGKLAAVHP